jgi:hypothetical protein
MAIKEHFLYRRKLRKLTCEIFYITSAKKYLCTPEVDPLKVEDS